MADFRHAPPVLGQTYTYASTDETTGCGVEKDWSYETPPGTLALPATADLLLWITFTVQVPNWKL